MVNLIFKLIDYCHASPYKTEIIKKLMDQYKRINGKQLQIQVDNKLVYSPNKNRQKGIKTIDFKEDSEIKLVNKIFKNRQQLYQQKLV